MDDRISTLPDEILCHILSFLQSEQAVATSVLSKRWNPLWLKLNSLSLQCPPWKNDLMVPPSIFSCRALVVLKLDGITFEGPYTFDFPKLKSLQLIQVVFFYKYQCFVELLNGCPILEDLKADIIFFGSCPCKGESINLPKLVSADIYFSYNSNHYTPLEALSNVQFLRLVQHTDMEVPVFSNLTSLELICCMGNISLYFVMDMLKNCPKLQNLIVDYPAEFPGEILDYPDAVPDCLSSWLRKCTLKRYSGVKCQKQFAEYILQNSPSLQTMTICSCHNSLSMYEHRMLNELALSPKSSPTCVVSFKFNELACSCSSMCILGYENCS